MAKTIYFLLILPISYLPLWITYRFSDLFYIILITIFPYRKKVITQNLEKSFPDKNKTEIRRLRNQFYKHFSDLLIEGIKNITISKNELSRRFKVKNPNILDELYDKQKNVILVSGHYNNWEWLITSQNLLFKHDAMGIGMPMTSKFWDKKINERRARFGMKIIHSKNFKQKITEIASTKVALLVLGDQSPGNSNNSYWMEFLNQPTAVQFGTEQIAHEYDFSVVYFITRKIKRGYYEMELTLITENPKTNNWGKITESHTRLLEKEIIKNPQFWLWSHKRWKRELPVDLVALKKEQNEKFNKKYK